MIFKSDIIIICQKIRTITDLVFELYCMVKVKKSSKQQLVTPWIRNWQDIDQLFDNFRKDFERTFSSFPTFAPISVPKFSATICDLEDEGSRFVAKVDLPGVNKKDVELNITENSVEISAEHKEEAEEKKKNYLQKERSTVSYYRTLPLPEKIVPDKVRAKLTDGTLNITLPKSKSIPKPKKKSITIQ